MRKSRGQIVVDAIKKSANGLTSQEISEGINMSINCVRFILKGLIQTGEIERVVHWYASNRGSIRTWVYILNVEAGARE